MEVSLYSAASAMNATERWQDIIADNLSTASLPGARQREAVFSALPVGQTGLGSNYVIPSASSAISFQQGELRPTKNAMDFAIEGKGFFTVEMPDGSKAYTRDGEFKLNAQGQLTTKQGYRVLADSGNLQFDPSNPAPITVSADGQVTQGQDIKGKLAVVEFPQPQSLTMLGSGLFRNDVPGMQPVQNPTSAVRQGYIELANASPTLSMASMITAMRMYESNDKVMQMQNDRMSRTITDLGGAN
jgi:flagellar basal body rod protein FlgG